jgi:hypothetical protein
LHLVAILLVGGILSQGLVVPLHRVHGAGTSGGGTEVVVAVSFSADGVERPGAEAGPL